MNTQAEVGPTDKTFATGLLLELLATLRTLPPGALVGLTCTSALVAGDLTRWCGLTGSAIIETAATAGGPTRFVLRVGQAPRMGDDERPVGSRLWLYTNFDCNLACDYCCVRSSPHASRRELTLPVIRRIAAEAPPLGVQEIFVTGGEPTMLSDIGPILAACVEAAPTTLLTNGLLLKGAVLGALQELGRDRITLQISLDSSTPPLHDLHRGAGTWARAWRGARAAMDAGLRVRLAATVSTQEAEQAFYTFLEAESIAPENRVVRRVAMRGAADEGVALSRADLVPEVTITAKGVYWHPVGADDEDMRITENPLPLAAAFEAVRQTLHHERSLRETVASIFHCA